MSWRWPISVDPVEGLRFGLGVLVATLLASALTSIFRRVLGALAKRTPVVWDDTLVRELSGPTRALLIFLFVGWTPAVVAIGEEGAAVVRKICDLVIVAAIAWAGVRLVGVIALAIETEAVRAAQTREDERAVRGIHTRIVVLRRIAAILVTAIGVAAVLLQFERVRSFGLSILASAGLAGVVLGFAAQHSLAALLAGIQLSVSQPIALGDVVVVEGEWGTIEDIGFSFVIVKIWDERRLVVPATQFLKTPFENWSRGGPGLHGTVILAADYTLPIDALRAELDRLLTNQPLWDGRTRGVVVLNATDRVLEIRVTVSAKTPSDLWDLRCIVREELVAWLRNFDEGRHLPRTRIEPQAEEGAVLVGGDETN